MRKIENHSSCDQKMKDKALRSNGENYIMQPLTVKNLSLKNRLVLPPMASGKPNAMGQVTDAVVRYYEEKSHGGYLSLIIVEHSYISPEGKAHANQLSVSRDSDVEGLRRIAKAIHDNGSSAILQISHAGAATSEKITGFPSIGPSRECGLVKFLPEREMTVQDMQTVVSAFADAACRAMAAGFDGVEVHSAHGYLLNQFYSPLTNRRTDTYGGSTENRIRLHLEITQAVRSVIGDDKALLLRLGACDYMDGGSSIADAVTVAKLLEKAGLDILDVSGGMSGFTVKGMEKIEGYFQSETEAIKKEIALPVILTGGITHGETTEKLLAEKKADLIGIGRAMLRDAHWAEKVFNANMLN